MAAFCAAGSTLLLQAAFAPLEQAWAGWWRWRPCSSRSAAFRRAWR